MVGGGSSGDNKVVATLRADGSVYPASGTSFDHLVNLIHYKIRTDVDISNANKATNSSVAPTTIVDLGKQLLQYARDGDLKGVKNMLSRGAPFTSDWLGMSALHFGAMNNQYDICLALLRGGINKDSKTKVDRTPLHMACYYGNQIIVELLLSYKCTVDPRDMLRMTPLHWAVEKGHKSIVRILLKHNADVTATSKFGKTAIGLAVQTEQADLLEELELARQSQINRKYDEENEKETSDAVNSIMSNSNYSNDPLATTTIARSIIEVDDDMTNNSDFAEAKISDLTNIKETGILDSTTINMLRDHGISMMPEDEDTSKELLNTALQNGRQLVLSEGGKLLLNETKKLHNNNNISKVSSSSSMERTNSSSSNLKNITVVPVVGTSSLVTRNPQQTGKQRASIISKAKDNLNMYKNVRIISLNDFKKIYGNTNIKGVQKIPASMASERIIRTAKPIIQEQRILNPRILPQRQLKTTQTVTKFEQSTATSLAEAIDIDAIIQLAPMDDDAEMSEQQQQQQMPKATTTSIQTPKQLLNPSVPPLVRQTSTNITRPSPHISSNRTHGGVGNENTVKQQQKPPALNMCALLSVPEICRQIYELRRQNDELRRKFEASQKEKEEMCQRLDRLEELLLVEKTVDDYIET
ncbi:uncharacterized protein Atac3 isoform X2 [Eurosta solidaginis]|uniref:uncharacterized protein Atac3 isoform X2 n=1 Tax=Eurosta solidaginis TaxID=178769 RepID=UPI003530C327